MVVHGFTIIYVGKYVHTGRTYCMGGEVELYCGGDATCGR